MDHFRDLSRSRYAIAIIKVEFELAIICTTQYWELEDQNRIEQYNVGPVDRSLSFRFNVCQSLQNLPNVKGVFIRVPRNISGLPRGLPNFAWQTPYLWEELYFPLSPYPLGPKIA